MRAAPSGPQNATLADSNTCLFQIGCQRTYITFLVAQQESVIEAEMCVHNIIP